MSTEIEEALRAADAGLSQGFQERDVEKIMACFAEDAVLLAVSNPVLTGREAIRTFFSRLQSLRGFSTRLELTRAVVSQSGDLGYTQGTYQTSMTGSAGKMVSHRGKYVAVWRNRGAGWQVVVHSSNPN